MTLYEYDNNELVKDLQEDTPEILKESSTFEPDSFDDNVGMYEGLAFGNDNPFFED